MKKSERKQLYALIREWTVCEIMARHGYIFPDFAQAYDDMLGKEDEIRKLVYGESNLLVLGQRWGLPVDPPKKKKKPLEKIKKKKHKREKKRGLLR